METIRKSEAVVGSLLVGLVCLAFSSVGAAQEEPSEEQIQLIIQFVSDADRETRAIGLQYVREQVPGEAATKTFAQLLPTLSPEGQVDLLDALGDRGDATARPAVLDRLQSEEAAVRAAALRALGPLGSASDVPLLAQKAAAASDLEQQAARGSLIRLRGDEVNAAIERAMSEGDASVRIALVGVLAARNAKETLPSVLQSAEDADPAVRRAALSALRQLADEHDTAELVKILKAASGRAERRQAELALLTVSSRGRQACAEAIIAGMEEADVSARIALLHALARAGGPKALEAIVGCLEDHDEPVCDEAVRMLSIWPDPAAAPRLLEIAKASENLRHQVLAIRGLVRLASPKSEVPADLEMLSRLMRLARRPQERRLILGVLGTVAEAPALALAASALDDPALAEEAGLAAVLIAEKMQTESKDDLRAAMEKVLKTAGSETVRRRAQRVLEAL